MNTALSWALSLIHICFDFTVNIEGLYFKKKRKYSCPSHNDIFDALSECKNNFPSTYPLIKEYINDLFHCKEQKFVEFNIFFSDYEGNKHPIEIILLALKWLFIEQDCAYWNYSGRKVLFNELINLDLAWILAIKTIVII